MDFSQYPQIQTIFYGSSDVLHAPEEEATLNEPHAPETSSLSIELFKNQDRDLITRDSILNNKTNNAYLLLLNGLISKKDNRNQIFAQFYKDLENAKKAELSLNFMKAMFGMTENKATSNKANLDSLNEELNKQVKLLINTKPSSTDSINIVSNISKILIESNVNLNLPIDFSEASFNVKLNDYDTTILDFALEHNSASFIRKLVLNGAKVQKTLKSKEARLAGQKALDEALEPIIFRIMALSNKIVKDIARLFVKPLLESYKADVCDSQCS